MKNLKIYFTSDVHGYLYPTTYGDHEEKNMGLFKCSNQFKKDGNTLIIDGGDMLQGSAFASYCKDSVKSPEPIAKAMNDAGYDFVTLGNHDFNYGMEYQEKYLSALDATCICENLLDKETKEPLYPYVIKEMENGLKVGVVGIVTDYVNVWEKKENIQEVTISDPFTAARQALKELKGQVDLTIGVYHGGFERDLNDGRVLTDSTENVAYKICEELDFDLLLTGHQHIPMAGQWVNDTYIVQTPEKAAQFVELNVERTNEEVAVTSRLCDAQGEITSLAWIELMVLESKVQVWLDQTAGVLDQPLLPKSKIDMAVNGTPIVDFVNQIQFACSDAQISVTSLANDINGFTKEVTVRDIIATYPYPNTLVVFEMTGASLKKAMERSAEYFTKDEQGQTVISETFLMPKVEHYNYDFYAGVHYVIDVTRPVGDRVTELSYKGKSVEQDDLFTVCVNNYRASGAGGYDVYKDCKVIREINTETVEMILSYFSQHEVVEVKSYCDFVVK
ncbi:MAG: bifunctional UDP-sugar hydrolase/5'-nucleotidase [bacterium]|nr:bifunctional UDP-sugar hydrolase/5'-nucleotidase [bacterium]